MSINSLSFNNSISNLACSTDQGFIIYNLDPDMEKLKTFEMPGGVGIVRMFGKTNMMLLVGGGNFPFKPKDTFILWDSFKNESIMEIDMKEPIKNVLINKDHLIAVLDKKICIFNWSGNYLDSKITYSNDKGLCVFNGRQDMIATLGTNQGEISIWKYTTDHYKIIKAHNTNIEMISLNNDGTLIATASERGTLIRVFNVETEQMEYEFRRGSNTAYIYDICFSNDSKFIACCSSNGTAHIWELYETIEETRNSQSILSNLRNYLPSYFSSQWGMKQIYLNNYSKSICAFDKNNDLHIATYDGSYFKVMGKTGEFANVSQGNLHINNK